ncbi:MAG: hypothetical protein WC623_22000 [Pedobacter sp.]|uniref:hypothetical protein n=1 Tax=Pedobacter sp. TaxID=1411316 RepID=UPI003565CD89
MIKGILTDSVTQEKSTVELEYEIETTEHGKVFQLIGGVTGYESFYIKNGNLDRMKEHGWHACVGTPNSWSDLFIPAEEMQKVII